MLEILKFVQGAVSKKDFVPYMSHFLIRDGYVRAYNGMLTLCSPIPLDLDCNPKASLLVSAIANCKDVIELSITEAGRLKVQSGKFKSFIDCFKEEVPVSEPEGAIIDIDGKQLLAALDTVYKFIGEDASRPWANGAIIRNGSVTATNNVCIIEYWLGLVTNRPLNIPKAAIREILRIGKPPLSIQCGNRSITFNYENKQWIKSQLLEGEFPNVERILNVENSPIALDETIFTALENIKPFVEKNNCVYFVDNLVCASSDLTTGANFEVESSGLTGVYNIEKLQLLKGTAKTIDWSTYPKPCIFYGERLRGAIVGMKR